MAFDGPLQAIEAFLKSLNDVINPFKDISRTLEALFMHFRTLARSWGLLAGTVLDAAHMITIWTDHTINLLIIRLPKGIPSIFYQSPDHFSKRIIYSRLRLTFLTRVAELHRAYETWYTCRRPTWHYRETTPMKYTWRGPQCIAISPYSAKMKRTASRIAFWRHSMPQNMSKNIQRYPTIWKIMTN